MRGVLQAFCIVAWNDGRTKRSEGIERFIDSYFLSVVRAHLEVLTSQVFNQCNLKRVLRLALRFDCLKQIVHCLRHTRKRFLALCWKPLGEVTKLPQRGGDF
ncbi:hypothetical protein CR47_0208580 [Ralstonia solanacearum]|nr:hypothetical protein CQ06_02015 [Ralstonia solanacearum]KFX77217.1 hypothetical protein KR98_20420 [Ralstonia solanacearum]KFX83473.1 hypothetical protein KR99_11635 [Ralstonia solanacearum]KFZ94533.1 hypothetical protein CR47_0208580 [Ralstonia solanacearum]OCQ56842.1 hypothetical protein AR463_10020 [Ralstonia solanacearum]